MNNKLTISASLKLLALSMVSASTATHAGSFGLIEQSASGQGAAYAGAAAIAEDASTIYFNPAGLTRLSGSQIVVAGHIISTEAKYTDNGSTGVSGPNSNSDETGFVPNFYYATELNNGIYAGVGVNVPYGLATDYDAGWIGRYHALRSEIQTININPAIAWKATDKISVGFGLNVQYLDIELTNNINSNAICFGFSGAICGAGTTDSHLKLSADSREIGWNFGMLFDVDAHTRIGVAYRSGIKHNVSGDADYTLDPLLAGFVTAAVKPSLPAGTKFLEDTTLAATAEMPDTISLSYVSEIDSQWTALADWTRTGWNSIDTIVIRQAGGIPGREPTLDLGYKNTNRFSVGVHYKADSKWTYRGGLAYDETPIRSAAQVSPRIPGNDRKWVSLGLGYTPSADWSLDFGYSHLFLKDFDINKTNNSTGEVLIGTYEGSVDIFSAQANFNF